MTIALARALCATIAVFSSVVQLLTLGLVSIGKLPLALARRLSKGPRHPRWNLPFEMAVEVMRDTTSLVRHLAVPSLRAGLPASFIHPRLWSRVRHAHGTLAGIRTETFTPVGWTPRAATVLYLHGGGYIVCSPHTHRDLVSRISVATGARCIAIDYRKAPEHPFPHAIDDALACLRALQSDVPAERLVVAGDSAGGGLALATMLRARDEGLPLPACAVLLSPWVDLELTGDTIRDEGRLDYLNRRMLSVGAKSYLGGADPRHPLASPVHADLRGLPPLLIQSGGAELLLAENVLLAERARAAGVEVVHDIEDGMVHAYHALAILAPEPRTAIRRIGAFVRARAGAGATAGEAIQAEPLSESFAT